MTEQLMPAFWHPRPTENFPERVDVRTTAVDIVDSISHGDTVVIGGFGTVNHPMSLVREIIRRELRDLTIVGSATAGLEIDLLVGAGVARKVIAPYVGGDVFSPIGHCFRRAAERKEVEIWECSEFQLYGAIFAGAANMSFFPWQGGLGSSLPDLNPDLVPFDDPISGPAGGQYLAVPAIRADVSLLHVGRADKFGNGQHLGPYYGDRWLARAGDRIVISVEQIVDNEMIRRQPFMTSLPSSDAVVDAPYGSHPFGADGFYREDAHHLADYVARTDQFRRGNDKAFREYLETFVFEPKDHVAYLERIGLRTLLDLRVPSIVGS